MLEKMKRQTLDAFLEERCREEGIPGLAVAVMRGDEMLYEKYAGYRDAERQLPIDRDTVLGVASITKSVTALAVMILADDGKLSADEPVSNWLPELVLPETHRTAMQINHLMSHTGGFPGMNVIHRARAESIRQDPDGKELFTELEDLDRVQGIRTADELIGEISKTGFEPVGLPGQRFNYSNEGYGLLQAIIERASGESYLSFVQNRIFEPLGMKRSVFTVQQLEGLENVTELYAYRGGEAFHSPVWWDLGEIYANGSMKSSIADLHKYLALFRNSGTVSGNRMLEASSVQEMTAAHIALPLGEGYGYGFQTERIGEIETYGHGGGIKGVSSHMKVVPSEDLAVVVLTNIAGAPAESVARNVLLELLDLEEIREETEETPLTPEQLQEFAGSYHSGEGQRAEITVHGERLQIDQGNEKLELRSTGEDEWTLPSGERLKFLRSEEGAVDALFRGVRLLPKTDRGRRNV